VQDAQAFSLLEVIMDDRSATEKNAHESDAELEAFTNRLIEERIASGAIDPATMSFSEMELLGHEIGQRVARMLGGQLTGRQSEALGADDYDCPTCGLECEALRHVRTVQTIDGSAEVVELKSYCPRCRRHFFPGASGQRPR
jgi:hypothetical protein